MDNNNLNILGENLRSYRIKAGFSLREIGDKLDLSHMAIQKYEQGIVVPNTSIIIKLADILQVPVQNLLSVRPKVQLDSQAFRKRIVSSSIIDRLQDDISHYIANYLQVQAFIDNRDVIKASGQYKLFNISLDGNCEEIAYKVRTLLGFREDCIDNLIQSLEDRGFLVMVLQDYPKLDGVSGIYNNIPIIVLTEIDAGDRMRFTIAHELGHLFIDIDESKDKKEVESLMDCFASSFLMPRPIVETYFSNKRDKINLKEIRDFKERYKVSMQAIVRRLFDLSIISESMKKQLLNQMYKNGMSINEPGQVIPEVPKLMRRIVSQLVTEGIISISKGAQLLDVNVKDFIDNALLDN